MTRLAPARADSIAVANRMPAVTAKIAGLSQNGWAAQRSRHTSRAAPISAAAVSAPATTTASWVDTGGKWAWAQRASAVETFSISGVYRRAVECG